MARKDDPIMDQPEFELGGEIVICSGAHAALIDLFGVFSPPQVRPEYCANRMAPFHVRHVLGYVDIYRPLMMMIPQTRSTHDDTDCYAALRPGLNMPVQSRGITCWRPTSLKIHNPNAFPNPCSCSEMGSKALGWKHQ